ncbi:Crp/Fnr family transcriptional regulator [Roseomonas sp. NAR14]|uniref:Crp/Fnr family transcriptional regulator n=1 Tax=Roseomonas acroporae TaxID=2937791 RepID=A0A9X1Y962_9PROT|nr:Crp/Fnr family transcriptional regulator [Roseomonas acroporae]
MDYIARRSDLPDEEIQWMLGLGEQRALRPGDAFCRIGQTHHEVGLLQSGILQVYSVSQRGEKVVLDLILPGHFALALHGVSRGLPSDVCIEAVTPCTVIAWPYELRRAAFARHPGWLRLDARLVEDAFNRKHRRYMGLRVLTAEERYDRMLSELPGIWQLLPQYLIASYLAITPQYLSRLKRRQQARQDDRAKGPGIPA